ncbi:hypothetical protein QQS21_001484 [Conoideocrella luteorostrata]|uniref:Uncharacterized protein n=1 Tax=Conoideocrella luteorostrata TaxID=1105319 RepID=A0AAJ0CX03_9HYPO|nr:hypothetical protein QQS21_001484 [Conoideocrella luteorostrata]
MRLSYRSALPTFLGLSQAHAISPSHLRLSAVVSGRDGKAAFECWQFENPFVKYPTVGQATDLAQLSNVTYVVLPAGSNEGIHKPPHPMLFVLLTGTAHLTLPSTGETLHLEAGENGLIVANDMDGEGHISEYPAKHPSIALQLPFEGGQVPKHKIVRDGPCIDATHDASAGNRGNQMPLRGL